MHDFVYRFEGIVKFPLWMPTLWNWRVKRQIRRSRSDDLRHHRSSPPRHARRRRSARRLMRAPDAGTEQPGTRGTMTDRQLRDELMTLFLAGHETTASALAWTCYLLAQHPEVEARLQAELQDGSRRPLADGRRRAAAALHGARDHRIDAALTRRSTRSAGGRNARCEIGGYDVPAGTTFLMSQWVMHHDPRYFDDPLEFRPERWADGLAKRIPKFAYFPFGGGPRVCVGNSFAMLEAVLILATIAQRFRFELLPRPKVVPWAAVTLRPKHGIHVVCHRIGPMPRAAPTSRREVESETP